MTTFPDPADLYPDVAAKGSLAAALQEVAKEHGFVLGAAAADDTQPLLYASVPGATPLREDLGVSAGRISRYWLINGWGQGTPLISGQTWELSEVAKVAREWRNGTPLRDIQQSASFVELTYLAEAAEQGPAQLVSAQWEWVRQDAEEAPWPEYRTLVEAAYAEPRLRQLFPYVSHWLLRFSTTTGAPFSPDVVCLHVGKGGYVVKASSYGPSLGETASPEEAVALAARHLPADIGPAVAGAYGK
ncbi:DUF6193 family natural product biosynthesis protein [Planobispora rosea]|uniref:DUF6193 family natural product biosynthesis protein n=1 Tax=Planobispora rosea TaxID=35762 RepID=UPI00083AC231|nr:DUF6193 family natural product biosynthesis protein [Planobispora rosea]